MNKAPEDVGQLGGWAVTLRRRHDLWHVNRLKVIMDWATRKVLAWRLSNTLHADFCVEVLARHGPPEIFDTDQGGQFTCPRFTGVLRDAGVHISMGGRGRWMDDVFIERLWRSLKCAGGGTGQPPS